MAVWVDASKEYPTSKTAIEDALKSSLTFSLADGASETPSAKPIPVVSEHSDIAGNVVLVQKPVRTARGKGRGAKQQPPLPTHEIPDVPPHKTSTAVAKKQTASDARLKRQERDHLKLAEKA